MGRHQDRTDLGLEFGATDEVAERGEEGIAKVRELSGGHGAHKVIEAVGHMPAYEQAVQMPVLQGRVGMATLMISTRSTTSITG
jgi:threonine dehydrogenase-like Zn-dependent dehydrogenase